MKFLRHRSARRRPSGFTLVEIMVVVVIIGLLAAVAVPAVQKVQISARTSRTANDFRVFAQAFETYSLENGAWPPNVGAGAIPAGMSGAFKASVWQANTAIGGRWNWDRNNYGVSAGISISSFTVADEVLTAIDAKMDDGDLSTGNLRKSAANRLTYTLEPES